MDDDDFFTDPIYSSSIVNIWHDEEMYRFEKPPKKDASPEVRYRIPLEAAGTGAGVRYRVPAPATGGNTASDTGVGNAVAIVVALAAVLGFLALCLHIWFNILPIKGY